LLFKSGFQIDVLGYDLNTRKFMSSLNDYYSYVKDSKNLFNGMNLYRIYTQATYKFNDQISINPGIHFIYLDFNKTWSLEPRLGFQWQVTPSQKLSFGYGLHSKIQTLYSYFYETHLDDGSVLSQNSMDKENLQKIINAFHRNYQLHKIVHILRIGYAIVSNAGAP